MDELKVHTFVTITDKMNHVIDVFKILEYEIDQERGYIKIVPIGTSVPRYYSFEFYNFEIMEM